MLMPALRGNNLLVKVLERPEGGEPTPGEASGGRPAAREAAELAELVAEVSDTDAVAAYPEVRSIVARATPDAPFGEPGAPIARRSLLWMGFTAAVGVALAAGLAAAVVAVRDLLALLLVAAFVAIGFDPVVRWLTARGLRRGAAVGLVMGALAGAVVGFVAAAVPALSHEATQILHRAPGYLASLQRGHGMVASLARSLHLAQHARTTNLPAQLAGGGLAGVGKMVLSTAASTLIVLVLSLYFLLYLPAITTTAYRLVPESRRARVGLLGDEVLRRIGGYLLGNLITSAAAAVATTAFCFAAGVPYAVFLGLLVGVFDLIPMVGALVAGVVVTLVALTVSPPTAVAAVVFLVVFRLAEDYLLSPRVMRSTAQVQPAVTVVAVLLGGSLFGITGALLAIPVAAAIDVVLSEVVIPRQDER